MHKCASVHNCAPRLVSLLWPACLAGHLGAGHHRAWQDGNHDHGAQWLLPQLLAASRHGLPRYWLIPQVSPFIGDVLLLRRVVFEGHHAQKPLGILPCACSLVAAAVCQP